MPKVSKKPAPIDPRPTTDVSGARAIEGNISRDTLYRRMREDPDHPRPFTYKGSNRLHFYVHELLEYRASRPRRLFLEEVGAEK